MRLTAILSSFISFNVPDARGRVPASIGTGTGLTSRILGASTGSELMTLTTNELPAHHHSGSTVSSNTNGQQATESNLKSLSNIYSSQTGITLSNTGNHAHTISSDGEHYISTDTGNGNSFSVFQPTLFIGNVFIYAGYK